MLSDVNLWRRLEKLGLDAEGSAFPFSERLARDNNWTLAYARRAVEEYKRFAYLACVTGREVTPSDEVDQVWHLHLTYSRHYWGPFTDALGRQLHHGPTSGGASEGKRYADNYQATLASYEREFGAPPPTDLWPHPNKRFGDAPYFKRISTKDNFVLSKRKTAIITGTSISAPFILFSAAAAHDALAGKTGFDYIKSWFLHMISTHPGDLLPSLFIFLFGLLVIKSIVTELKGNNSNGSGGDGCTSGGSGGGGSNGGGSSGCGGCGGGGG